MLAQSLSWPGCLAKRRATADARLGAAGVTSTYVPLAAVAGDGGAVPRTLLVLLRKYPQLVSQRTADGSKRTRTQAAAARAAKAAAASAESVRARCQTSLPTAIGRCHRRRVLVSCS